MKTVKKRCDRRGEAMIDKNCHDCKYLESQPATDTWLRVGDIEYWCDNEDVIEVPQTLEDEMMDIYPDMCNQFVRAIAKSGAIAV